MKHDGKWKTLFCIPLDKSGSTDILHLRRKSRILASDCAIIARKTIGQC